MGIDFGLARIGIAFSDETKFLATPYVVYKRKTEEEDLNYFINIIKENKVESILEIAIYVQQNRIQHSRICQD